MTQNIKLLDKIIFFIPRLILFGIIMFSLVITLVISLDALATFRPPLKALRQCMLSWLGM